MIISGERRYALKKNTWKVLNIARLTPQIPQEHFWGLNKMERKTDIVRRLVAAGKYKEALRIAKDFRLGITEEDSDAMKRGYECLVYPQFYQSIGINPAETAEKGREALQRLFGI